MKSFTFERLGRTLLLAAVMVVGAICVSYGDNPPDLLGRWVNVWNGSNIELFKDGTGVVGNSSFTWKTEGKRFVFTQNNKTTVSDYSLSGYELTRTYDDASVGVWVRKDKVEEYWKKEFEKNTSYFTDSRNGRKYLVVKIKEKTWMAENLNYQTKNSWCYGGIDSNCEKYGRLYAGAVARTACPADWHLPSDKEWLSMVNEMGGTVAGNMLKSTSGWDNNGNGIYNSGFSALPGGYYRNISDYTVENFEDVGKYGYWWTATDVGDGYVYF